MSEPNKTTLPLMRTVDKVKSTTTNVRGFADSVDHLLNAFEEFFPFIEKAAARMEKMSRTF
ncbi:MAG: hypothetical protein DBX41_04060, partial [Clostridiales bacterium]